MATELAKQLQQNIRFVGGHNIAQSKQRPSLLFTPQEAAHIDLETFYQLGATGFTELTALDPSLAQFNEFLFAERVKTLDRALMTQAENDDLDKTIRKILRALGRHFLIRPATKLLEWMIRRFRIEELNTDAVVRAFIPYYGTTQFLTLAQVLDFRSNPTNPWRFLSVLKKAHAPLNGKALTDSLHKERSLLAKIHQDVLTAAKSGHAYRAQVTFYFSVVLNHIEALPKVDENALHEIMPLMIENCRTRSQDLALVALLAFQRLSARVKFSTDLFQTVLTAIVQAPVETDQLLFCVLHLVQNDGDLLAFSRALLEQFVGLPQVDALLLQLANQYDVKPVAVPYMLGLAQYCHHNLAWLERLAHLLKSLTLPTATVASILEVFLLTCLRHPAALSPAATQPLLMTANQQFSEQLDQAIAALTDRKAKLDVPCAEDEVNRMLYSYVREAIALPTFGQSHQVSDSMYLELNHPEPHVRLLALKQFTQTINAAQSADRPSLAIITETLLDRLLDRNDQVLQHVLTIPALAQVTDHTALIGRLATLLEGATGLAATTTAALFQFVMVQLLAQQPALATQVTRMVLPLLLSHPSTEAITHALVATLPQSPLAQSPLLANLANLPPVTDHAAYNLALLNALAANLAQHVAANNSTEGLVAYVDLVNTVAPHQALLPHLVMAHYLATYPEHSANTDVFPAVMRTWVYGIRRSEQPKGDTTAAVLAESSVASSCVVQDVILAPLESSSRPVLVLMACLRTVLQALPRPSAYQAHNWFALHAALDTVVPQGATAYPYLLLDCCALAFQSTISSAFQSAMIQVLFETHLRTEWLAFLAALWCQPGYAVSLRRTALQIGWATLDALVAGYVAQSQFADFQLVLPSLLLVLGDASPDLRQLALCMLATLHQLEPLKPVGKKGKLAAADPALIYQVNLFYGPVTQNVEYLRPALAHSLVAALTEYNSEITTDARYIQLFLCNVLSKADQSSVIADVKHREACLASLLSYLPVFVAPGLQRQYLTLFTSVVSTTKLKACLPLLITGLQALNTQPSDEALLALVVDYIKTYDEHTVGMLRKSAGLYWDAFVALFSNQVVQEPTDASSQALAAARDRRVLQLAALQQVSNAFFGQMHQLHQQWLFQQLLQLTLDADIEVQQAIKDVFGKVAISSELVKQQLSAISKRLAHSESVHVDSAHNAKQSIRDADAQSLSDVSAAVQNKKGRPNHFESMDTSCGVALQMLVTLLELLTLKANLTRTFTQVPVLFTTLNHLMTLKVANPPVAIEYVKQLTLSVMTETFKSMEAQQIATDAMAVEQAVVDTLHENSVRVDLLVQCIRTTTNPQTQRLTLQLLAAISSLYPERVLHNVMPVFTFMGVSVLRQDDAYTFRVIAQTLEKILSPLTESHRRELSSLSAEALDQLTLAQRIPPSIKPVLYIFADALFHIPKHRRLPFYTALIRTLGEDPFLVTLWSMVLERYSSRWAKDMQSVTEVDSLPEFCLELGHHFSAETQLGALVALLESVHHTPSIKPEQTAESLATLQTTCAVDLQRASNRTLRHFKLAAVQLVSAMLDSQGLLDQMLLLQDNALEVEQLLEPQFMQLVKAILVIISEVESVATQLPVRSKEERGWRQVTDAAYQCFQNVQRLMHMGTFTKIVQSLLQHPVSEIRQQGLTMLNTKLETIIEQKFHLPADDEACLVALVPVLCEQLGTTSRASSATLLNRQLGVVCLMHLASLLGTAHPKAFVAAVPAIMGPGGVSHANSEIVTASLLCLVALCRTLGPRVMPHLKAVVAKALSVVGLADCSPADLSADRCTCAISGLRLIEELVVSLPQFTVAFAKDILTAVFHANLWPESVCSAMAPSYQTQLAAVATTGKADASANTITESLAGRLDQLQRRVTVLFELIQEHLKLSTILLDMFALRNTVLQRPRHVVIGYFGQLTALAKAARTADHRAIYAQAIPFFIDALEIRHQYAPDLLATKLTLNQTRFCTVSRAAPLEFIDAIEEHTITALTQLTMKLNEAMFKPLFAKLLTWATQGLSEASKDARASLQAMNRLVPFFRLQQRWLERLKMIAAPYYASVLTHVWTVLDQFPLLSYDTTRPLGSTAPSAASKPPSESVVLLRAQRDATTALWQFTLGSLAKALTYDTHSVFQPKVFAQLVDVLTRQITRAAHLQPAQTPYRPGKGRGDDIAALPVVTDAREVEHYLTLVQTVLVPCFTQVATKYHDDTHWKALNRESLLLSRSEHPCVRLASLYILQAYYHTFKEEFLILLPETIPFLAELMEDENHVVETETQKTNALIEQYLGEPLQKYFD
ncbi:snoRNA-binding rRNA-processing protein utp10 [Dimargaris verticillata]|uniref:U3 small nucleolar RNA-associated protein 10 n=1 Tax=Dimargaris verticillata TaxID=2761393 RepID=A0A9W8ED45_9FUNG|nr:snoRNA-binding rRNA-processing protein utp10 [Dimargaris verticillata]